MNLLFAVAFIKGTDTSTLRCRSVQLRQKVIRDFKDEWRHAATKLAPGLRGEACCVVTRCQRHPNSASDLFLSLDLGLRRIPVGRIQCREENGISQNRYQWCSSITDSSDGSCKYFDIYGVMV